MVSQDESSEDEDSGDEKDKELLPSAEMSGEELYACQVAMKLRFNWSDTEFYTQMEIMQALYPDVPEFPGSLYLAKKGLKRLSCYEPQYIVYCRTCDNIVKRSREKITCAKCERHGDLDEQLARGDLQFVTLPIRAQIMSYLEDDKFKKVLRQYSYMTGSHARGTLHGDSVEKRHFDLFLSMDGAALFQKIGNQALPALILMNNLPVSLQLRCLILIMN